MTNMIYKLYVRLFAVGMLVAMVWGAVAGWLDRLAWYNEGRLDCYRVNLSFEYCDVQWAGNYPGWVDLAAGAVLVLLYAVPAFVSGYVVLRLLRWALDPLVANR